VPHPRTPNPIYSILHHACPLAVLIFISHSRAPSEPPSTRPLRSAALRDRKESAASAWFI
jgi:hypothetical protein